MTNAEKYTEVFGLIPEVCNCPTKECKDCPEFNGGNNDPFVCLKPNWWNQEYKEVKE